MKNIISSNANLSVSVPTQTLLVARQHKNETEAWRNYFDLRKKFLNFNCWSVKDERGLIIKFTVFNSLKRQVTRPVQVGDWIGISQSTVDNSPVFLKVKDIHNNHECDSSEECIKLIFEKYTSMELTDSKVSGIKELVLKRKQSIIEVSLKKLIGNESNFSINKNINWLPIMKSFLKQSTVN